MLSLLAYRTNIDFTLMGTMLFFAVMLQFFIGMIAMAPHSFHFIAKIHQCFGVILFVFFFVHDTQIFIGGDHIIQIEPDRYIFAATNLFVDIELLYCYLLQLINFYMFVPRFLDLKDVKTSNQTLYY